MGNGLSSSGDDMGMVLGAEEEVAPGGGEVDEEDGCTERLDDDGDGDDADADADADDDDDDDDVAELAAFVAAEKHLECATNERDCCTVVNAGTEAKERLRRRPATR